MYGELNGTGSQTGFLYLPHLVLSSVVVTFFHYPLTFFLPPCILFALLAVHLPSPL